MLDYTVESVNKTVSDLKRIFYIFSSSVQALCILYLVYLLAIGEGFLIANVILLSLGVSHFVFNAVCYGTSGKARARLIGIRNVLKYAKLAVRAITLIVAIYGIYVATTHVTPTSIILTSLMAVSWVLQIILEFVCYFVESRASLIVNAMKRDAEVFIGPLRSVGSFVKRAAGYESTERAPIDVPEWLDERVEKKRCERREERSKRASAARERRHERYGALTSFFKKKSGAPRLTDSTEDGSAVTETEIEIQ